MQDAAAKTVTDLALPLIEGQYQGGQLAYINGQVVEIIPRTFPQNQLQQKPEFHIHVQGHLIVGNGNQIESNNPIRVLKKENNSNPRTTYLCAALCCLGILCFFGSIIPKGDSPSYVKQAHSEVR